MMSRVAESMPSTLATLETWLWPGHSYLENEPVQGKIPLSSCLSDEQINLKMQIKNQKASHNVCYDHILEVTCYHFYHNLFIKYK